MYVLFLLIPSMFSIVSFKNRAPGRLCEFEEDAEGVSPEYNEMDAWHFNCADEDDDVSGTVLMLNNRMVCVM